MSKLFILGGAAASAAVAAGTYYVSPSHEEPSDIPALVVEMSSNEAIGKLQQLSVRGFLQKHIGLRRDFEVMTSEATFAVSDMQVRLDFSMVGERLMAIDALVEPISANRASVDIRISFPDSRFSESSELRAGDLETLESVFDLITTEYVSAQLNGHRLTPAKQLEPLFLSRTGLSKTAVRDTIERSQQAVGEAYRQDALELSAEDEGRPQPDLREVADSYPDPDWGNEAYVEIDQTDQPADDDGWGR